ncbi:hypothetical protein GCM10010331_49920 [Streptomyces xanthochromogenes]|uniref:DUF6197 family protein n=1 Tax=Streptomyces xanthochromogenes TaxID=67384 RepID=UPI001672ECFC|nr:hypothetical protein [Streptomyces xanthochromogenes]GHB56046.1 hypothetical protein GCM10010331_49920 [Streptomyces xanthochromogenes]
MSNPQLAFVYLQAADIIRANGHHQGGYLNGALLLARTRQTVPVDATGALSLVITGDPVPPADLVDCPQLYQDAVTFLGGRIHSTIVDWDPEERIADWNDQDGRTAAEVIAAFESAAADIDFMFSAPLVAVAA